MIRNLLKAFTVGLALVASFTGPSSRAQSVDVKDLNAGEESSTTIEIRKGGQVEPAKCDPIWEFAEGNANVESDPVDTQREARSAWRKACEKWEKAFRADNKENRIIAVSCGEPACSGDAGYKTCTSKAFYKIKTRMN
ncbi:MAG: hypothetical protein AB7G93_05955 [Bdellovibrionales bacterium]